MYRHQEPSQSEIEAEYRAKGICLMCLVEKALEGYELCEHCLEEQDRQDEQDTINDVLAQSYPW